MPVYAYQCTACGTAIEVRQSFSDDALTTCEVCGGRLRKRFDNVGVTFKGSGFYRTDSRVSSPSSGSDSKESASSSGSDSSSTSNAASGAARSSSEGSSAPSSRSDVSSSSS